MSGLSTRIIKSEFLSCKVRHQYFLALSGWKSYTAHVDSHCTEVCQIKGEKLRGWKEVHTHLAVQSVFWTHSVSIAWELIKIRNLKLRCVRICILTSFSMTPLHIKIWELCHRFLDNCNHLLTGLFISTLAPLEFVLLRYYCWGLSTCQIWVRRNRLTEDETTFWWGQSSETVETPQETDHVELEIEGGETLLCTPALLKKGAVTS